MKNRNKIVVAGLGAGAVTTMASAQSTQTAVDFPIDLASLSAEIATAGATVLVIAFSIGLGFVMVKKLAGRLTGRV